MFGGLFGGNKTKKEESSAPPSAGKVADAAKLKEMKSNLAKIENNQKRDYEAESKARTPPPPVQKDKQTISFNFNKPNEFPNLFKGEIKGQNRKNKPHRSTEMRVLKQNKQCVAGNEICSVCTD